MRSHVLTLRAAFAALLFLALFTVGFGQKRKPAPRPRKEVLTVRGTPAPPPPSKTQASRESSPKTLGVTVESYRNNIEVNVDGTSSQTTEVRQILSTQAAIDALSNLRMVFNGDLDELSASDVYVIRAGNKRPLMADAVKVRRTPQAEAAPSFSSLMELEIDFGKLEVGDIVNYKVHQIAKRTHFKGKFDDLIYLPAIFEWRSAEINLSAPAGHPLQIEAIGFEGGQLPETGDGRVRWQWRVSNLKDLEIEPLLLDILSSSPRLAITSFRDFEELGAAYWAEAEKKAELTPEIQKLADEITRNSRSQEQQAYDIYQWVNKNIRYLSIILDRSGWIPHSSTEIIANRYGDCKDYTTVLNSLLRAKGIESYPVLIRSDLSSWFPKVAIPAFFNHEILYIPSLDLFADATVENTRLGSIPQTIVGKKGFLAGKKLGVIQTPSDRPDDNQVKSSTAVTVLADGGLRAVSTNTYVGRSEILFKPLFSGQDIRERSDSFVSIVLAFFGQSGSGRILKVGDQFNVNEPFTVELEIKLDSFTNFVPAGKFTLPIALNLNNLLALEHLSTVEKRQTDLLVGAVKFTEDYLVSLPEGVTPDIKPLASEFSNSVGSYRVEVKMDPSGSVRASRELTIKKDLISATEYIQFRELVRDVVNNYNIEIAYKADPAAPLARQPKSAGKPDVRLIFTTDGLPEYFKEKKISAVQARRLEGLLLKSPELLDARRDLVRYYSPARRGEPAARRNARIRHYRWFIENRPEARAVEVFGIYGLYHNIDEAEFSTLKPAWLAAVEKDKKNSAVRMNAYEFLKMRDRTSAENILVEGMRLDPSDHVYPVELSNLYSSPADPSKTESPAQRTERIRKQLDHGNVAIQILKSERSSERHEIRKKLLQDLAQAAFETSDLAAARSLATELILDFGQDADDVNYDSASHIGNIVLGRVALKENDVQKAAEHLLIAIRAPLRKTTSWLPEIDTTLARDLFLAGQKDAVLEYLKLCEGLWNLKNEKELFEYQSRTLKKWQEQIRQGQTPSFDFMKP